MEVGIPLAALHSRLRCLSPRKPEWTTGKSQGPTIMKSWVPSKHESHDIKEKNFKSGLCCMWYPMLINCKQSLEMEAAQNKKSSQMYWQS